MIIGERFVGGGRRRAVVTAMAGVLTLSLALYASESSGGEVTGTCMSPRAVSGMYPGSNVTHDRSARSTGVEIVTQTIPSDAGPMVFGYRPLTSPTWIDSNPADPELARRAAVEIPNDAVIFSTRFTGIPQGSSTCELQPDTVFSETQPFKPLVQAYTTLPEWSH